MRIRRFFENSALMEKPEVGDWVVCEDSDMNDDILIGFLGKNIGRIVFIIGVNNYVEYKDIPSNLYYDFNYLTAHPNTRSFARNRIKYWSKDRKDVELYIEAKKYNL